MKILTFNIFIMHLRRTQDTPSNHNPLMHAPFYFPIPWMSTKNWIVSKPRRAPAQLHQRAECNAPTPLRVSRLLDHRITPTRYVDLKISRLLPVSNVKSALKVDFLRAPEEFAHIIADSWFSARHHFEISRIFENFIGARRNLILKFGVRELNIQSVFSLLTL